MGEERAGHFPGFFLKSQRLVWSELFTDLGLTRLDGQGEETLISGFKGTCVTLTGISDHMVTESSGKKRLCLCYHC